MNITICPPNGYIRSRLISSVFFFGALSLSACQSLPEVQQVPPSNLRGSPTLSGSPNAPQFTVAENPDIESKETSSTAVRTIPSLTDGNTGSSDDHPTRPRLGSERLSVTLAPQTVPEFINAVFGEILNTGFVLGPGVAEMTEIISYRSADNIRKTDLYSSASSALMDYGVAIVYIDGEVRAIRRDNLRQLAPRFIRSRARSSVPSGMRPVVQFVDLYGLSAADMEGILRTAFPTRDDLAIRPNNTSNSLTLTGLPGAIDQALGIINQMDELRFSGTDVVTLQVQNWNVVDLAKTIEELLTIEGYSITSTQALRRPIVIRPIPYTQQLAIFSTRADSLNYVIQTVRRLDADAAPKSLKTARVYQAKHYEASTIAEIISSLPDASLSATSSGAVGPVTPTTAVANRQNSARNQEASGSEENTGDFVVDEQGNRIIFNADDTEYRRILGLLREIDTPAPEILVEITIAEITLTDDLNYGVEALIREIGSTGYSIGTLGNLGLATGGLTGSFQSGEGDLTVNFGAGASNNQINVLSTPRIVTKSGVSASIQVGTDVPIITTQTAGLAQSGGTTDILQTVEYRSTGILVNLEPLVLSGDRIDMKVSQEVSSAEANPNQAISSPIISNRSITSELTLQDGQTAILGGLIENRYTRGTTGVPFLKDIPILGALFSTETLSQSNTILMVMITPYILETRGDRASVATSLASEVNDAFRNQIENSKTLTFPEKAYNVVPLNSENANE